MGEVHRTGKSLALIQTLELGSLVAVETDSDEAILLGLRFDFSYPRCL